MGAGDGFPLYVILSWPFHITAARAKRPGGTLRQAFFRFLWANQDVGPKFWKWVNEVSASIERIPYCMSGLVWFRFRKECYSTGSPCS